MEISNVCLFYNIAAYYKIKQSFDMYIKDSSKLIFDYRRYYDDKTFKTEIIKLYIGLCFSKTVELIRKHSGVENVNNWMRSEKNEKLFLSTLSDLINDDGFTFKENYEGFIKKSKITI